MLLRETLYFGEQELVDEGRRRGAFRDRPVEEERGKERCVRNGEGADEGVKERNKERREDLGLSGLIEGGMHSPNTSCRSKSL